MSFLLKYSERTLWEFSVPFNPIKLLGLHFWEKPQGVFVMLVVVALPHLRFFIHFFLTSSLIFSWVITRFTFKGIYLFSPAHCKVIWNTFIFTFWAFHFIPSAVFSILHSCRTFSYICDSDNSRISSSMILLYACSHRVVPSGWGMVLDNWFHSYKPIVLSCTSVSHEVKNKIWSAEMF